MVASEDESGWEQLFRLVFEQSSHPIVLLDEDRGIVAANAAAAELWGSSEVVRGVDVLVRIGDCDAVLEVAARPALDRRGRPRGAIVLLDSVTFRA